jgi:shikimate dehydrogenase
MKMTDQYGVVGHPIAHSKSPLIHSLFAAQTGQSLSYDRFDVAEDGFERFVTDYFARPEGKGLNVTVPHKERAWAMAQRHSERAALAGAVNTLYRQGAILVGDNTDGVGLVQDLTANHGIVLQGMRILVIGAGGAVRGVLQPILMQQPASVTIVNRTVRRAEELVSLFVGLGVLVRASFESLDSPFDLIINGSSASLQGEIPPLAKSVVGPHSVVYDLMYGREATPFNRWAADAGAQRTIDGLGMLVEQAAEAFWVWRGVRPDTRPVIEALREQQQTDRK